MITVRETENFKLWIRSLKDLIAQSIINARIAAGNFGDAKPVGNNISELTTVPATGCISLGRVKRLLSCCAAEINQPKNKTLKLQMESLKILRRFNVKPIKTTVWDPAEYLETEEQVIAYLDDIFKSGDPTLIVAAIGDVARAQGMSKIADETNHGRESLYKSLSPDGNPSFGTVLSVLSSLGFGLRITVEKVA